MLVFREETCSRTSLTAALTRAGYRLQLDHQFSGAVDINETGLAYWKNIWNFGLMVQQSSDEETISLLKWATVVVLNPVSEGQWCQTHSTKHYDKRGLSDQRKTLYPAVAGLLYHVCATDFNIQTFYVLPTQGIYMFRMHLWTNYHLFQHTILTD